MNTQERIEFRKSKQWQQKREEVYERQNGKDYITGYPLHPGWNCHHLDTNFDHYDWLDESNGLRFIGVNKQTHECIHFFYRYRNTTNLLEIMQDVLEAMSSFHS